jgi:integrator complex subunit 7
MMRNRICPPTEVFFVAGLRSGRVGEQCEAIVRFPRLFEKYPFPILINSSLLKLADVFRVG